jgi:hypothetical protein
MLQQITKRLYFNKWPIKVECYLRGSNKIARIGATQTLAWCEGRGKVWDVEKNINLQDLKSFTEKTIAILEGKECQIRTEGNHFNIFCKDRALLESIKKEMNPWIRCITEPENDQQYEFLISQGHKKVICKEYPYGQFRYRIYLKDRVQPELKQNFLAWVNKTSTDSILISGATESWLSGERKFKQDPFFYVLDEKTLSMILLYVGNNVKKVQEFILRSNINT